MFRLGNKERGCIVVMGRGRRGLGDRRLEERPRTSGVGNFHQIFILMGFSFWFFVLFGFFGGFEI